MNITFQVNKKTFESDRFRLTLRADGAMLEDYEVCSHCWNVKALWDVPTWYSQRQFYVDTYRVADAITREMLMDCFTSEDINYIHDELVSFYGQ